MISIWWSSFGHLAIFEDSKPFGRILFGYAAPAPFTFHESRCLLGNIYVSPSSRFLSIHHMLPYLSSMKFSSGQVRLSLMKQSHPGVFIKAAHQHTLGFTSFFCSAQPCFDSIGPFKMAIRMDSRATRRARDLIEINPISSL
jgi:hypothetical protein